MRRLYHVAVWATFVCSLSACGDVDSADVSPSAGAGQAQSGTCVTIDQDVHIGSAADLNRFAGLNCFEIDGSLAVRSPDLDSLDELSGLRSVSSFVSIYDNSELRTLDGLASLESVGGQFDIAGNPSLDEIVLPSLESVGFDIRIFRNGRGFVPVDPGTQRLALSELRRVEGDILVTGNPRIDSIQVPSLRSVGHDFTITRQMGLDPIELPSLEEVGGSFEISHSFSGLVSVVAPRLRTVGDELVVERNFELEEFRAPELEFVGGDFIVQFNRVLPDCEMEALADSVARIVGEVIVLENDYYASCPTDGCTVGGGLVIRGRQDIRDFQATGCTTIVGDVLVEDTDLRDFSGMENLQVVNGEFFIRSNDQLTSLRGLQNMRVAKRLWLEENPQLTSLAGLDALEFTEFLQIRDNAALTSLDGLELLESAGRLILEDNPALVNLDALGELRETHTVVIRGNASLPDLDGLANLRQIVGFYEQGGGLLIIEDNPSLTSLAGLESLDEMRGAIRIVNNDALEQLTGLFDIEGFVFELVITDNDTLPTCEALALRDAIADSFTDVVISGNDDTGVCR